MQAIRRSLKFGVVLLLVSLLAVPIPTRNAYAIFGVGDIVFDPSSFTQQMISYMNQVRQYLQQCQQYSTQLKQLAAQTQNLQSLGYVVDLSGLQDMQKIMSNARGIASDYAQLQRRFDDVYPEFHKFSTMTGKDFAAKAMEWNQETANSNRDALNLISKSREWFNSNSDDLRRLTVKANNVAGAKDGLQSIAQLAALQNKQLLELQQTISASAKAEGAYMQQRADEDRLAREQMKRHFGDPKKDLGEWKNAQKKPGKMLYEH